jgi:hypothetical protein
MDCQSSFSGLMASLARRSWLTPVRPVVPLGGHTLAPGPQVRLGWAPKPPRRIRVLPRSFASSCLPSRSSRRLCRLYLCRRAFGRSSSPIALPQAALPPHPASSLVRASVRVHLPFASLSWPWLPWPPAREARLRAAHSCSLSLSSRLG